MSFHLGVLCSFIHIGFEHFLLSLFSSILSFLFLLPIQSLSLQSFFPFFFFPGYFSLCLFCYRLFSSIFLAMALSSYLREALKCCGKLSFVKGLQVDGFLLQSNQAETHFIADPSTCQYLQVLSSVLQSPFQERLFKLLHLLVDE